MEMHSKKHENHADFYENQRRRIFMFFILWNVEFKFIGVEMTLIKQVEIQMREIFDPNLFFVKKKAPITTGVWSGDGL